MGVVEGGRRGRHCRSLFLLVFLIFLFQIFFFLLVIPVKTTHAMVQLVT